MRKRRVGSFTFGAVLIALGGAALINNILGYPEIKEILKWWPLILILFGLELLVYNTLTKEDSGYRFDGLSIFLLIILLMFSFGLFTVQGVIQGEIGREWLPDDLKYPYETRFEHKQIIKVKNQKTLRIDNPFGSLKLEKGGQDIELHAVVEMRTTNKEQATSYGKNFIEIREDEGISIAIKRATAAESEWIKNTKAELVLKVPESIDVEVTNGFGEVEAKNLNGKVKITNRHGLIETRNIGGQLSVVNSFGEIKVEDVLGKVNIENRNGNISARGLNQDVNIENSFGSIEVYKVTGKVTVRNENGEIEIREVKGDTSVNQRFGGIHLTEVEGIINIEGENGEITVENSNLVSNAMIINNRFGGITLDLPKNQTGHFNLKAKHGTIQTDLGLYVNKDGSSETVEESLKDDASKFNISVDSGNINIQ